MSCRICGAELPQGAMFCGECGSSTSATPESRRRSDPRATDTTEVERLESPGTGVISVDIAAGEQPVDAASASPPGSVESDQPRPADAAPAAPIASRPRFVLRFSTGESRTVSGTGLIGRRPLPQPGEEFDQLVQIADRTLSVSKTHLEFGEHDGVLWVADRFSGNGTIVTRPDEPPSRCEPGRRYLVPAGTRVDLADQYFTVG